MFNIKNKDVYLSCVCISCKKTFRINTIKKEHFKFGAVCPMCKTVHSLDLMFQQILVAYKNDGEPN